jgi:hypothetical protein
MHMQSQEIAERLDKYRGAVAKIRESIASEISYLEFQLKNESLIVKGEPPLLEIPDGNRPINLGLAIEVKTMPWKTEEGTREFAGVVKEIQELMSEAPIEQKETQVEFNARMDQYIALYDQYLSALKSAEKYRKKLMKWSKENMPHHQEVPD